MALVVGIQPRERGSTPSFSLKAIFRDRLLLLLLADVAAAAAAGRNNIGV